ncbi:hypothetical protein VTI74DRAFT_9328 [Chaetomium olivicolor]
MPSAARYESSRSANLKRMGAAHILLDRVSARDEMHDVWQHVLHGAPALSPPSNSFSHAEAQDDPHAEPRLPVSASSDPNGPIDDPQSKGKRHSAKPRH